MEPAKTLRQATGLLLVAILIAGIVIGQLVASALDLSGVSRILVCTAAIFVLSCAALGLLLLRLRRRQKALAVHEREEHPQTSPSSVP